MNRKVSCQGEDVDVVWVTLNWTDWLPTFLFSPCRYGAIVLQTLLEKNSHIQGGFSSLNHPHFFVRGEFSCCNTHVNRRQDILDVIGNKHLSPYKDNYAPPKTKKRPLKNDGWKTIFLPFYINGSFVRGRGGGVTELRGYHCYLLSLGPKVRVLWSGMLPSQALFEHWKVYLNIFHTIHVWYIYCTSIWLNYIF